MISFDDFIKKWTGKPSDFDGVYGNQCMDLMHQYLYDVLGLTDAKILQAPTAWLAYKNFNWTQYFTKIDNTPMGIPNKGDIMFWNTGIGSAGHVAMYISGNVNKFYSFDQNFPTGSLPKVVEHYYDYVAGWLRPKTVVTDPTIDLKKRVAELESIISKVREAVK